MLLESYLHWVKTILSNWIFQQIECYFFSLKTFAVSSQLPKKKNQSWEKNLQYIVFATEKMIHWMWWIQNSFVFICFCDMAKYGSSKNLDLIRLDAIQLKKNLCTHAANILVLKICHYKGNSMRTSSGIMFCVCV